MAIKVKREDNLTFSQPVDLFFKMPGEEDILNPLDEYEELKNQVYKLDIDYEEKANMINKIGSLKTKNDFEKSKLIKEINEFKKKYNLK
jgi:hypothetical protein